MWSLIKTVVNSRVGQALCLVNLGLVGYCYFLIMKAPVAHATLQISYVGNGGFIAGRWIDFDSSLLLALTVANTLPILFSNVVSDLVIAPFFQSNVIVASWAYASLLLTLASTQWLIVGRFIEKMVKLYRDSRTETPHLTRG
jgi:hypothetical protein